MWSTWIENYIWVVILGLVLYRDGVREVQDGDGRFHGTWSRKLWSRWNTEGLSTNLEFLHHGEEEFPGQGAGQVVSLACQQRAVCCLFFNHYIKLCVQQSVGWDNHASLCSLSLVLYRLRQSVCDLCVSFPPSILGFSYLNTVLVSSQTFFFFNLFSTRDKIYCFCRNEMQGKNKPTLPPPPNLIQ